MQNDIGVDNMNNDFGALTIVQGKVDNWTDYEGDQLQITIDGTTYLVHAANAIMKT